MAEFMRHRTLQIVLAWADLGGIGAGVPVPALKDGDFSGRAVEATKDAIGRAAAGAGGAMSRTRFAEPLSPTSVMVTP
jgi:hypothetical protein